MNVLRKDSFRVASAALFFAFSLTLIACNKQNASQPSAQTSQPSAQVQTPQPAPAPAAPAIPAGWSVVSSSKGGFTIAFPKNLDGKETDPSATGLTPGIRFSLDVPDTYEPKTNFGGATLTVGASGDKDDVAQCMKQTDSDVDPVAPKNVVLNGAPFTVYSYTNMGCGNEGDTTSYRILRAGKCVKVEYTIQSANLGNYDPSQHMHAYDSGKITALLESIVATFKFQ